MTTQELPTNEYTLDGADSGVTDLLIDALPEQVPETDTILDTEPTPESTAETATEETSETEVSSATEEVNRLRAENDRLTREARQQEEVAFEANLQNAAAEFAQSRINQYMQQGYDEQVARQLGVSEAREQVNAYRAQQAVLRATRVELGTQYGVPQEQLMSFQDPTAMRHYAEQYANTTGPQAQEVAVLKRELAELKASIQKGQVPANQQFDQASTNGGTRVTADNIDALYVQYQDEHPGQPNPYENRYREFLNRR